MAASLTKSDALGYYLTADGLGGQRTDVEFQAYEHIISSAHPALIIERVGAACGTGRGSILASGGNSLVWTAPGDTAGTAVAIGNNTSVLLESGTPGKSVRVYRDSVYSAADMEGYMYLDLVQGVNNAIGLENVDEAGGTHYGCLYLTNHSDAEITGITVTPGVGYTVGTESVVDGTIQTIADSTTAPTAVSFGASATVASLAAGASVGLWIKRIVAAATAASIETQASMTAAYTYGGTEYTDTLSGIYRIGDTALALYELYASTTGMPDVEDTPAATSATLPFSYALAEEETHRYLVRRRNQFDLVSMNTLYETRTISAGGADASEALHDPEVVSMTSVEGGEVAVRLRYNSQLDATPGDTWRLYITTDGVDPDPSTDTEADTTMIAFGFVLPTIESTIYLGPYAFGTVVKVVARVYSTTLDAESAGVGVSSLTVSTQNPVGVHRVNVAFGTSRGAAFMADAGTTYYNDPTNTVGIRNEAGEAVLFGTDIAFRGELGTLRLFRTSLEFANGGSAVDNGAGPIEVVSADEVYICVNGQRRMEIDFTTGTMKALTWVMDGVALDVPVIGPIYTTATATYIQVRNRVTGRWTPVIKVDSDSVATIAAPVLQEIG